MHRLHHEPFVVSTWHSMITLLRPINKPIFSAWSPLILIATKSIKWRHKVLRLPGAFGDDIRFTFFAARILL